MSESNEFSTEVGTRIWEASERRYKELKMAKYPYRAPATLPGMESDSVRAIVEVVGVVLDEFMIILGEQASRCDARPHVMAFADSLIKTMANKAKQEEQAAEEEE